MKQIELTEKELEFLIKHLESEIALCRLCTFEKNKFQYIYEAILDKVKTGRTV